MALSNGKTTFRQIGFFGAVLSSVFLIFAQSAPEIRNSLEPLRTSVGDVLSSRGKATWWDRLTNASEKDQRIAELEAQVQMLSNYKRVAITMQSRMETYERILKVMGEPLDQGITARIVAEIDGPFSLTRLANAGVDQGILEDAIAINEGGLVGRVIQRGRVSSRILLVSDYNSRVPIMGEVSGARAVLFGDRDGDGTLTDMPEPDAFRPGERILTSGEGGLFPSGILVGRVYEGRDSWRVALAMKDGSPDFVRLVPPMMIRSPEDDPIVEPADAPEIVAATGEGEGAR